MKHSLLHRMTTLLHEQNPLLTPDTVVLAATIGSHSHGTYVPPTDPDAIDDTDIMGVVIPPPEYMVSGLQSWEGWNCQHEELDIVTYSLAKWTRLMAKGNPNVLGLLWLRDDMYLKTSHVARALIRNRDLFSSRRAYDSFAGYADNQLRKMTSYSPEIQNKIDGLTKDLEDAGWHLQDIMDRRSLPMPKGLAVDVANAKATILRDLRAKYHAAYMGEKRRRLVVQHGYDTKNAAHLIRLLTMCKEFMTTGQLNVYRTHDADLIRDIKRGLHSLEDVKALAQQLFEENKHCRDTSPLPEHPDIPRITRLVTDLTLESWSGRY